MVGDGSFSSLRGGAKDPFSGLPMLPNAAPSALDVRQPAEIEEFMAKQQRDSEIEELLANVHRHQLLHTKKEEERKKTTLAAEEQAAMAAATQTAHALQLQFNNSNVQASKIKELRSVAFGDDREGYAEVLISVLQADGMDMSIEGNTKRLVYAILAANSDEALPALLMIEATAAYKALEDGGAPNPLSPALIDSTIAKRATAQCNVDDKAIASVLLTKFLGKELEDVRAQLRSASEVGNGTSPTTRAMEMFLALKKHERPVSREAIRAAYQNILKATVLFNKVDAVAPVLQALLDTYSKSSREMTTLGLGVAASPAEYLIQVITQSPQNGGTWLTAMGSRLVSYVNSVANSSGEVAASEVIAAVGRMDASLAAQGGKAAAKLPPGAGYLVPQLPSDGGTKQLHSKVVRTDDTGDDNMLCLNCYEKGHYKSDCTNEVVCRHCSKTGHIKPNCPDAGKPATTPLNYGVGGAGHQRS